MNRKYLVISLLIIPIVLIGILLMYSFAFSGSVTGFIETRSNEFSISYRTVFLVQSQDSQLFWRAAAETDTEGRYMFEKVPMGDYYYLLLFAPNSEGVNCSYTSPPFSVKPRKNHLSAFSIGTRLNATHPIYNDTHGNLVTC